MLAAVKLTGVPAHTAPAGDAVALTAGVTVGVTVTADVAVLLVHPFTVTVRL